MRKLRSVFVSLARNGMSISQTRYRRPSTLAILKASMICAFIIPAFAQNLSEKTKLQRGFGLGIRCISRRLRQRRPNTEEPRAVLAPEYPLKQWRSPLRS